MGLLLSVSLFISCKDGYFFEENEPDWLRSSIYDYLQESGKYTNYIKLIDDLKLTDVMKKTGSVTLFVADDDAFNRFYQKNGISGYNQLTLSQKKLLLNFSMINNAYLIERLSNYYDGSVLKEDAAMRSETAVSIYDSIAFDKGDNLPIGTYWDNHKAKGLYLMKDNTASPTVYFLQNQMEQALMTDEDFSIITGKTRTTGDAYIFDKKIIDRDIRCKNGYVNVLDEVLMPPANMAEYIRRNSNTRIFSLLLDRYSAPYYNESYTNEYKRLHPEFTDSIFVKHYFSTVGPVNGNATGTTYYPNNSLIGTDYQLPLDPGWNSYVRPTSGNVLESDMAAMFVPNDAAMDAYFNTGAGTILKERFGSWDNIPNNIVRLLIKRHMRTSFLESIPSRFGSMMDDENSSVPVQKADIQSSYVGVNGAVYVTNKVYPPDHYVSVYAPVLFSEKTKVFYWAIAQNDFTLYLNSLVSKYSFFVPTDDGFTKYIDPIAYNKDVPAALKFWYNTKTSSVNATVYKYNKSTGEMGDSIGIITTSSFIKDRLLDMLNSHIVVGSVETGKKYYQTKGTNILQVAGTGTNLTIRGGGDIEQGTKVSVKNIYAQTNGNTYFIDKPIQAPLKSVYKILSEQPEFSAFFALLNGFPSTSTSNIFVKKKNYSGLDFNVKFFNTFNYTVYVPTNAAIESAINSGVIIPWDSRTGIIGINDMTDATAKAAAITKLERFLRYHFQDNSVFISGNAVNGIYQSATLKLDDLTSQFGTYMNKFYRIGVSGSGDNLTISTENGGTAHVVTSNGLYNLMARDYIFNDLPANFKEITGTGTGTVFTSSSISTSSTAVIHQIDNVLNFK
ncbi:fasciclin domain-containing protein [Parabacteroides sp. FAFU027]|uniref:fasciclin domain-containing protein n=1 Tax=Parabacteroides sp. FAFU027 TaxID=2922715 RepID=UPI001FAEF137|nr:fasciclin domain-containing protein [Parabacteroides sp. FAFU027]